MHRSRLGGIIIDCKTDDLESAADFWSKALGYEVVHYTDPQEENYLGLKTPPNDLHIEIQRVDHESRVHIDIETDDIEAEAVRLEKLGAKRIGKVRAWLVMRAPSGQQFCLVEPQRSEFKTQANKWD